MNARSVLDRLIVRVSLKSSEYGCVRSTADINSTFVEVEISDLKPQQQSLLNVSNVSSGPFPTSLNPFLYPFL